MRISLFSKKKEDSQTLETEGRKYFEVWGDALESARFHKRLCLLLAVLSLLLLVLLNRAQLKPPLVIRVNAVGKAEPIHNINATHHLTKPEVLNFVKLFMTYFLERNFYTWKDNLVEATRMMTASFQEKVNDEVNLDEEIAAIQVHKLTSTLNFSTIEVLRETEAHILVSLKGWRKITSTENSDYLREIIFEGELTLKKVSRTMETPYGLLVDSYTQKVFKNE